MRCGSRLRRGARRFGPANLKLVQRVDVGAGSASQRAIGTGVMGGMITATSLAVFFVPIFFVLVRRVFKGSERQRKLYAHEHEPDPAICPRRPGRGLALYPTCGCC